MSSLFLDQSAVHALYSNAERLRTRTRSLLAAKIAGPNAAETICDLLAGLNGMTADHILDIGCGRGTTTIAIAKRFKLGQLTAVDASASLLADARRRIAALGLSAKFVEADFHQLPLDDSSSDGAVAAFCLYHSPSPATAIGELVRCLRPNGVAVLATKSLTSYTELDSVVSESGLDPHANGRPSLYSAFHSGNMEQLASAALNIQVVMHERHIFRFSGWDHLAKYLATTPKYMIGTDSESIAKQLHAWQPDRPVTASSTVSYLLGAKR
jgi:SAM-dependent methyltransferase